MMPRSPVRKNPSGVNERADPGVDGYTDLINSLVGETKALTLEELTAAVERVRREKPGLQKVEIVLYENSPDRDRPAVTQLQSWAQCWMRSICRTRLIT